jgi:hypothetical protein
VDISLTPFCLPHQFLCTINTQPCTLTARPIRYHLPGMVISLKPSPRTERLRRLALEEGDVGFARCGKWREALIVKPDGKPNRVWLVRSEENNSQAQNPTLDQVNRQISVTTVFMSDHPWARAEFTSVSHTSQLFYLAEFFCHASTRTAVTVTDPSRRRTEHQHRYDLSLLLPRNTYKRR